MLSDNQEENLYTIINNLLDQVDELLHQQIQLVGTVHYVVREHQEGLTDFEKKQVTENLDKIQYQFQVFREDVSSANKCLRLLGLPELELKGVIPLDENDKTKV